MNERSNFPWQSWMTELTTEDDTSSIAKKTSPDWPTRLIGIGNGFVSPPRLFSLLPFIYEDWNKFRKTHSEVIE